MPKTWYDIHRVKIHEEDDENTVKTKRFNKEIIADKKPYFMIYIYPELKQEYNQFISGAKAKCGMKFGISFDRLLSKTNRTDEQNKFVEWYYRRLPVIDGNGVMNRICHLIEQEFNGYVQSVKDNDFSYKQYLSNGNYAIIDEDVIKVGELYERYL